jgi:hypothetical protein
MRPVAARCGTGLEKPFGITPTPAMTIPGYLRYAYKSLLGIAALLLGHSLAGLLFRLRLLLGGGAERLARARVEAFVKRHPDWHLRLYRTPAGLRVLVLHRTFAPGEASSLPLA